MKGKKKQNFMVWQVDNDPYTKIIENVPTPCALL